MHPFNLFPSLLSFSFFTPLLLRVTCGAFFCAVILHQHRARREIKALLLPLVGKLNVSLFWALIVVETATAFALILGWQTQLAAILGAALAVKLLVVRPHSLAPYGKAAYWLLLPLCLSLVVTGAGALAMDMPL